MLVATVPRPKELCFPFRCFEGLQFASNPKHEGALLPRRVTDFLTVCSRIVFCGSLQGHLWPPGRIRWSKISSKAYTHAIVPRYPSLNELKRKDLYLLSTPLYTEHRTICQTLCNGQADIVPPRRSLSISASASIQARSDSNFASQRLHMYGIHAYRFFVALYTQAQILSRSSAPKFVLTRTKNKTCYAH